MTNNIESLQQHGYTFSEPTIAAVMQVACAQTWARGYEQYFREVNPALLQTGAQFVDLRPDEHDPKEAVMVHLPMANPLDPNQLFNIATIAHSNPNKRIISYGNPSGYGYPHGGLSRSERRRVAGGDFGPITDKIQYQLLEMGIDKVSHVGYSFGADLAAEASAGSCGDVDRLVVIEPASVVKRGLKKLGSDFASTASSLKDYVKSADAPVYEQAREVSVKGMNYNIGLLRPTNVAVARGLAKGGFEERFDRSLTINPEMKTTLAWGSESELAIDGLVKNIAYNAQRKHGYKRTHAIRLVGDKHALANNIYLHAAIVREGLN